MNENNRFGKIFIAILIIVAISMLAAMFYHKEETNTTIYVDVYNPFFENSIVSKGKGTPNWWLKYGEKLMITDNTTFYSILYDYDGVRFYTLPLPGVDIEKIPRGNDITINCSLANLWNYSHQEKIKFQEKIWQERRLNKTKK